MGKVEKGITGLVEGLDSVIRTSLPFGYSISFSIQVLIEA